MTDGKANANHDARTRLSARYLVALRKYVGTKTNPADTAATQGLGRAARTHRLNAPELAAIHEKAVLALSDLHDFTDHRTGLFMQANAFFSLVLRPLENEKRPSASSNAQRRLEREILRRKLGELAVRKSKDEHRKMFAESEAMQRKLRDLTRQILSAQEEERKKISRELHDEVVQTLVGINVQLSALNTSAANGLGALKIKIAKTQRLVESSVNAVHRFARELRPAVLDDLGLIPALHAFSKNLAAREKIKIQLTAFGGVEALNNDKRTVLYRVAQEALTNVARHAQATNVSVNIRELSGIIRMEISDDGRSFQVEKMLLTNNHKRLGLVGMKERIEMVGGTFTIESTPSLGTTVRAELPFDSKTKK